MASFSIKINSFQQFQFPWDRKLFPHEEFKKMREKNYRSFASLSVHQLHCRQKQRTQINLQLI